MELQPVAVSVDQAAVMLGLSKHTVRKYEREGQIKATRIGSRVLIPVDEINRIVKEGIDPFSVLHSNN